MAVPFQAGTTGRDRAFHCMDLETPKVDLWSRALLLALVLTSAAPGSAIGQTAPPAAQGANCPPGVGADAPAIGRDSNKPLSDQLAASKGVICPPAGVDPQIQQRPPEGGTLKVIPPPGSPGGNPNLQPK